MNQRFLMWGLTSIAFVVTLAISSWQEGLWQPDTLPVHSARASSFAESDEPANIAARPLAPMQITSPPPTQTVAAVIPPPPPADPAPQEAPPPVEEPPAQPSAQDLDEQDFADHRDREAGRSARTR